MLGGGGMSRIECEDLFMPLWGVCVWPCASKRGCMDAPTGQVLIIRSYLVYWRILFQQICMNIK